ncbi:M1 family metallopeptidase [Bernardetia sp.]|uniref:M1 family metallopeptidase n=1 Tax=Bernardetia sp. TaxID=1937974 RepID=UPI0025BCD664|nr:M1 family metallopeptidase [Bernardetia sp.]
MNKSLHFSSLSLFFAVLFFISSSLFISCKSSQQATNNNTQDSTHTNNEFLVPIEESENQFKKDLPEPLWKPKKGEYHATQTKIFDLIHTKLNITPDWENQWIYSTATLTVQPYFYSQNKIDLDAKGLAIESIKLLAGSSKNETTKPLRWDYDGTLLTVRLDREYTKEEKITIEISYIAKPNEAIWTNSVLSNIEEEGFFFINPEGKTKGKPRQIWTQGETSNNAMWFPTFDAPNFRGTQEVYITIADSLQTLSNGRLVSSQKNGDGTRTDYWKMEKPHSPYLTMVAVGEFAVVEDKWKDIPLYYYTEKWHAPYAKDVFGKTPEMLEFYSNYLDYKYPWSKYAQVIVRDYTSGAMENTSASVFMEGLLVDKRSIEDHNWEGIISHELFHQWFGDLMTAESWANLAMNESFANYGEYLWLEHSKGKKEADQSLANDKTSYFRESQAKREPIIRYFYTSENDMFDSHSYSKGSVILNMLRQEIGDEAFKVTLQKYVKANAFKSVELDNFRLIAEEVTGRDLKWFFNQWFLEAGHPELTILQDYQDGTLKLTITQTQDLRYSPTYLLPLEIDIWENGKSTRHKFILEKTEQSFEFKTESNPELVVFDPTGYLLAQISQDEKSAAEWRLQAKYYDNYIPKRKALYNLAASVGNDTTFNLLMEVAKNNDFGAYRTQAIRSLGEYNLENIENPTSDEVTQKLTELVKLLKDMAKNDKDNLTRASAIDVISQYGAFPELWEETLKDSSYFVISNTMYSLMNAYGANALSKVEPLESIEERHVVYGLGEYYSLIGVEGKYDWYVKNLDRISGTEMSYFLNHFTQYLINQPKEVQKKGIEYLTYQSKTNSNVQTRKDTYQALSVLSNALEEEAKLELEIEQKMADIRNEEKDRRVAEFQEALGF